MSFLDTLKADLAAVWNWFTAERAKLAVEFAPTITELEQIGEEDLPGIIGAGATAIETLATGNPGVAVGDLIAAGGKAILSAAAAKGVSVTVQTATALASNSVTLVTQKLAASQASSAGATAGGTAASPAAGSASASTSGSGT